MNKYENLIHQEAAALLRWYVENTNFCNEISELRKENIKMLVDRLQTHKPEIKEVA